MHTTSTIALTWLSPKCAHTSHQDFSATLQNLHTHKDSCPLLWLWQNTTKTRTTESKTSNQIPKPFKNSCSISTSLTMSSTRLQVRGERKNQFSLSNHNVCLVFYKVTHVKNLAWLHKYSQWFLVPFYWFRTFKLARGMWFPFKNPKFAQNIALGAVGLILDANLSFPFWSYSN